MILLNQMLAFFIFMLIGYYARKKDILDDKGCKGVSWLVSNAANPALILFSVVGADSRMSLEAVESGLLIAFSFYTLMTLLGLGMPYLLRAKGPEIGSYRNLPVYSNIGFMGIPLARAYMGPEGVQRISMFIIVFNLFMYSVAVANFQRGGGETKEKFDPKNLLNVGMIACLLALFFNFVDISLPVFAETALEHLNNMAAALSMICIGAGLANCDLKKLFSDTRLLVFAMLKMLVLPIAGTLLVKQFMPDTMMVSVIMLMLSTPVASMVSIMADRYNPKCTVCVRAVALTSLMAVVTVPLVSLVTGV